MDILQREAELQALEGALAEAREGRGRLVVVEGVAGSGKSALLAATRERAEAAGLRVLSARGAELERGFAFGTIRQLFETAVTGADPERREQLLAGAAAPAAAVLSAQPEGNGVADFAALHSVYWLATNLSLAEPLLIAVDDVHWVDHSSLRSLSYLAGRIADLPIALVAAMRPHEPGAPAELIDGLRFAPDAVITSARPLTPASVATVVRGTIPRADDAFCDACFEATAGNPFYLRELLRTLAGNGHGALDGASVHEAAVPAVADRVLRRIARLGPEAPRLASAMAVLGDGGRLADAAALAGLEEAAAAALAHRLTRIEVLAKEDPYDFVHPLVRRSVYDALTVTERDAAHRGAARLMRDRGASPEVVAAHLAAVRPAGSAEVVAALEGAAEEALARGAPDAAIGALRRALAEESPDTPRAALLHRLGQVELMGRDLAALGTLTAALELAEEPAARAHVALDLSVILGVSGRWEASVEVIGNAIAGLGGHDDALALELEAVRAVVMANDSGLVEEFDRDRARLKRLGEGDAWAARALSAVLAARAAQRGSDLDDVMPLVEHALDGGRLLEERGAGGWAAAQCLGALILIDADARAEQVGDEVAAIARRDGSLVGSLTATLCRAWLLARRGDLAAAEAECSLTMDVVMQNQMWMEFTSAASYVVDVMLERGALPAVAEKVETLVLEPAFMASTSGALLLETRARLRAGAGRRADAVADLRAAGEIYVALGLGPPFTYWRSSLAHLLPPEDREQARALVEDELARTSASGLARPHGMALRMAATLAAGDDGIERLRESVALLEGSCASLEHARSLVELGAALRRRGNRAEAREPLAEGRELAHRAGAERTLARATEELAASGARPRRIARSGIEALTPSERRVAGLVTGGRSNTEVAQELLVSLKTVETHLSRVYAKFGLSGPGARRQLQRVFAERT